MGLILIYFYILIFHFIASQPPILPTFAQVFLKVLMATYLLMWFQSFYLLYVRIKTRKFRFITVTRFGLWRLDVPNMGALTYFIYPPLVLADLLLQHKIDNGERDLTNKIPLFGGKFLVIISAAWGFLWVCACQCVSIFFDEKWSSAPQERNRAHRLPRYVIITMNTLFVVVMTWIIPVELALLCKSNREYDKIREILRHVVSSLRELAVNYKSETYRPEFLFLTLLPARQIFVHEAKMVHYFRTGFMIGLVDLLILSIVCAPLLKTATRAIRKRRAECTFALAGCSSGQAEQLCEMKIQVKHEYWTLFVHGMALYLTTIAFIPVMVWQLFVSGTSFMRTTNWITVTQLGMHGPYAITGNLIVFALNLQARRLLMTHFKPENSKDCAITLRGRECDSTDSDLVSKEG
ncbi:expressed protein [Phakopsora pachyrhizi]|uniref:Expressed protein n=1 Tax=Phakopsora pachyrhizi TaxID=170000 RepID=A0AAV0BIV0_PHAPC|nr:expressed protein [Phakopsora pachyrhizi]